MNSLQGYFFGVAEKHHGHEPDFIESMFETSFLGEVQVDDRGQPIWRTHRPGEHDLPDHPQRADGPGELDEYGWPKTEREGSTMTAAQPLTAAPPKPAAQSRMTLAAVTKGKVKKPHRIVGYGPEGIGKSSFAAGAPNPVFLPLEDGTNHLDVARLPKAETWREAREAVRLLINEKHEFQTLVIDTLDALEALLWRHMIERDKFADEKQKTPLRDIESYGYGKGYTKALEDWRGLLKDLEALSAKGVHVVLLAHSQVKPFKNPAGEDYERYELKLHQKAAGLMKEWAESVLFMNYETFAKKDPATKRVKGIDSGARLIFTERRAAYDAKHRGNLPESLPLSWADFEAESQKEVDPKAFAAEILRKAAELGPDVEKLVSETVTKAAGNVQSLININNRVNARLAEAQAQKEES
ncbi:MAG: ATP-binding protein [Archangium sp.]|nr:ATP-binding protein [Archangium sp.]